jgi:hypothetical protein
MIGELFRIIEHVEVAEALDEEPVAAWYDQDERTVYAATATRTYRLVGRKWVEVVKS